MGLLSRLGGEIPQVGIVDENTTALTYKAICQGRCSDKEFNCSDIATRGPLKSHHLVHSDDLISLMMAITKCPFILSKLQDE